VLADAAVALVAYLLVLMTEMFTADRSCHSGAF